MSSMMEKLTLPSRFLLCLIVVSMFVLIISSWFLLQISNSSPMPNSVFQLVLINSTPICFSPDVTTELDKPSSLSITDSLKYSNLSMRSQELPCQNSKSDNALGIDKTNASSSNKALLRVYMYDLPPQFHFGLLGWKGSAKQRWPDVNNPSQIPRYPGGLNLQHSVEYWLTLDLLSSDVPHASRPCGAIRVQNASEADIIFVPFFSSLSYNRYSKIQGKEKVSVNDKLQDKLVEFLNNREEWKRLKGKNHLIVAHHPNSMLIARRKLGSSMFVLADFGRYPVEIANLEKDVIAPYKHVVRTVAHSDSAPFDRRPILLYFQGAIYRKADGAIRQELYYLLKEEKDVHFAFGSVGRNGINQAGKGMASSKFCLNLAGDTPSSNRLFDAIASHCVPVIISDDIELPFEDVLDYVEFCIFIRASDAVKNGFLLKLLRGIKQNKWTEMWEKLKQIVHHFEYRYPSQPGDAVNMIWEAVSRKTSSIQFEAHRRNRYRRTQLIGKGV